MPYIKVDTDKIKGYRNDIDGIKGRMEEISRTYASTFWAIDSGAYSKDPGIRTVGNRIYDEISSETMVLARMKTFLAKALSEYDCTLETYKKTTKSYNQDGSDGGDEFYRRMEYSADFQGMQHGFYMIKILFIHTIGFVTFTSEGLDFMDTG